ncbi:MAG: MBL fold metallo-hydrolase [Hyphomonadaceae bacterium]
MLETTFIGHQGWQFATARARILVDPLLVEEFGHRGGVGVVFPPRIIDLSAMEPVDAVIFTHEHEDHFNIPSLARIARSVPIFVPARSSTAMRQVIEEAGFIVRLYAPGDAITLGDLQFTAFAPDHVSNEEQDEWETTPFLILDTVDGGSFFTSVDVAVSPAIEAHFRTHGLTPGLWAHANNVTNLSFQALPAGHAPAPLPIAARFIMDHIRLGQPRLATLMCGGGFSFTGLRAWMNNLFFPLNSSALFEALQRLNPAHRYVVPSPGWSMKTTRDAIVSVSERSTGIGLLPRERWPDRSYQPASSPPAGVSPASGRTTLAAGEREELVEQLKAFADFLYGSALFRILYSLSASELPAGVKPGFAISVLSGEDSILLEYDPGSASFQTPAKAAGLSGYAAGIECYATDLLEFLRCRLPPSALMFGRLARWRGCNRNVTGAIDNAIWQYGHPLRHPAAYLDFYRAILAEQPADAPQLRARG